MAALILMQRCCGRLGWVRVRMSAAGWARKRRGLGGSAIVSECRGTTVEFGKAHQRCRW